MKKIIYIDDNEINTTLFKINFKNRYIIFTTEDPYEGIEIIKKEGIQVIITDYKMPKMNGMELIEEVKQYNPGTICMILSGYMESEVVTDKSKIFKYIMKPFKPEEIIHNIDEAFNIIRNPDYKGS